MRIHPQLSKIWSRITNYSILILSLMSIIFFLKLCGATLGTAATSGLLYQPRMIGDGDCGDIGGMKIGRENRSTRRKPAPAWTRATVVGIQRLTAWAMGRPSMSINKNTLTDKDGILVSYIKILSALKRNCSELSDRKIDREFRTWFSSKS
jgi:hypothetical protein